MAILPLAAVGTELFAILEMLRERVAVIISADLAHTHLESGPYGYSNDSQPFDEVSRKLTCWDVGTVGYLIERVVTCRLLGHGLAL